MSANGRFNRNHQWLKYRKEIVSCREMAVNFMIDILFQQQIFGASPFIIILAQYCKPDTSLM